MIINKKLITKWTRRNKKHYESLGYEYSFINEPLIVDIKDTFKGDTSEVDVLCDFCKENILKQKYSFIVKQEKHTCNYCRKEKRKQTCLEKYGEEFPTKNKKIKDKIVATLKETCLDKYGVDNAAKSKVVQEKIKQTNLKKYGVERPMQSNEVKEKVKQTCIENYGVDHPWKSELVKQKVKDTNLEKYGVNNPWKSEAIKEKRKQYFLEKYGVDNPSKSKEIKQKTKINFLQKYGVDNPSKLKEIKQKIKNTCLKKYGVPHVWMLKEKQILMRKKARETMYKNGTAPSSKQQRHICEILNGELNFPVGGCSLDIAFPNEMIYIEYDGSGHNLCVKLDNMTQEKFNQRDNKRVYYLKSLGWKIIRFVSSKDILPSDDIIIKLINECKNYLLNSNHSWIEINIDENSIKCKEYVVGIADKHSK